MMVGVVIPVFNRLSRLQRAVDSVLSQTGGDLSLVVVDDGSTRDLSAVREKVEAAGQRWLALGQQGGPAMARNAGVRVLPDTVGWLAFLDSDDEWLPGKLVAQREWHCSHPDSVISQTRERWIRDGSPAKRPMKLREPEGEIFVKSVARCCISPSAVMLRRDVFDELGGFDESYKVCEDYQLWLQITLRHPVGLVAGELVIKNGGAADQLTAKVPAFDRWRLRALLEILPEAGPRRDVVLAGISEKARILERGAERQGRVVDASTYGKIQRWAESPQQQEQKGCAWDLP